jgi:uncharacterized protein (TIGR02145 family)
MAENLKTTKFNDGLSISLVTDATAWIILSTPGYCWYHNNAAAYRVAYGALYNWYAVNTGKLCPIEWHVPSNEEWIILISYMGGESVAGSKLKESGIAHWHNPNTDTTNETGFTALPGGERTFSGNFINIGLTGYLWSSSDYSATNASYWSLGYNGASTVWDDDSKKNGFSVRCIND